MKRPTKNPHAELCAWANGLRPDSMNHEEPPPPTNTGQQVACRQDVFSALRSITEEAIERAKSGPREVFHGEPINWAAIRCAGVEYWEDDSGGDGYRVTIDECSPSCSKLHLYIGKALADSGYPHVEVRTEW